MSLLTVFLLSALFVGCIATAKEKPVFFSLLAIYVVLIISALLYGAFYIKADSNYIVLGSPLRSIKIRMCDVENVELFQPTMGAIRVLGSSGFMSYWGFFRESDIGKYYGFYGRSSDCFLVRLKNEKNMYSDAISPIKWSITLNHKYTAHLFRPRSKIFVKDGETAL